MIGVMCGAITNTPALGAAQQTVLQVNSSAYDVSQQMSMGYAAAYPLGVVGIILTMILIKVIFKVNIDDEIKEVDDEKKDSTQAPAILTYKVTNELVSGLSMVKLHTLITCDYTCSRILKPDGKVVIPTAQDTIEIGDLCLIVCAKQDEEIFSRFIGQKVEMTWPMDKGPVVSRRIVVTQPNYNGVKLGALHLHETYELNVTRVNRAGMDLLASPNLRLQIGDRVTVVGKLDDIEHLARKLGNSMKRLNEPNLITMFIGIFLGIILGSLPIQFPGMSVPMKLGLAGGPLVVAILIGAYGHKFHLVTYTNSAANLPPPRDRHLPLPRLGGYRRRKRLRGNGVQLQGRNVGGIRIPHHCDSIDSGWLHRTWQVQDELPIHTRYDEWQLHRSPGTRLRQQGCQQRRSRRGLLHGLSAHDVHACDCGASDSALLPVAALL